MHTIFSIDFPIAIIDGGDNFEIFEYGGEEGKQTNEKLEKSVKSYVRLSVYWMSVEWVYSFSVFTLHVTQRAVIE